MNKIIYIIYTAFYALPAYAQLDAGLEYGERIGLGNRSPVDLVIGLIQAALGFLGLLLLLIILLGGVKWMVSAGNDDKQAEARKTILGGIVGALIIMAAWGLTGWLLENFGAITGTEIM